MAGVFDIDLDQPEDAGSDEELEEGVRAAAGPGRERGEAAGPEGGREGGRGRRRGAGPGPLLCPAEPEPPALPRRIRGRSGPGLRAQPELCPALVRRWDPGTSAAAGLVVFFIIYFLSHVRTSVQECRSFWSRGKSLLSRQN